MRALPLLSDEDLIYLGVSDAAQRRRLLRIAKRLMRSSAQPPAAPHSSQQALQPVGGALSGAAFPASASAQLCASSSRDGKNRIEDTARGSDGVPAVASPEVCTINSSPESAQKPSVTSRANAAGRAGLPLHGEMQGTRGGNELEERVPLDDIKQRLPHEQQAQTSLPMERGRQRKALSSGRVDGQCPKSLQQGGSQAAVCESAACRPHAFINERTDREAARSSIITSVHTAHERCSLQHASAGQAPSQHSQQGSLTGRGTKTQSNAALQHVQRCESQQQGTSAKRKAHVAFAAAASTAARLGGTQRSGVSAASQKVSANCRSGTCTEPSLAAEAQQHDRYLQSSASAKEPFPADGRPGSAKEESQSKGKAKPEAYLSGALGHLLASRYEPCNA